MKKLLALCLALFSACALSAPAAAESGWSVETTITVEEEWLDDGVASFVPTYQAARPSYGLALAQYGVFRVIDAQTVELNGVISSTAPRDFAALLRAFPQVKTVTIVDCAGTDDDEANFALARMIRTRGLTTYVPSYGSTRSGGVELFLAGARRRADAGAQFAVHSWRDEDGYEASDYGWDDPVHQDYIHFYRDMGMSDANARAFYQLTNSVGFDDVLWLSKADLARFIAVE